MLCNIIEVEDNGLKTRQTAPSIDHRGSVSRQKALVQNTKQNAAQTIFILKQRNIINVRL